MLYLRKPAPWKICGLAPVVVRDDHFHTGYSRRFAAFNLMLSWGAPSVSFTRIAILRSSGSFEYVSCSQRKIPAACRQAILKTRPGEVGSRNRGKPPYLSPLMRNIAPHHQMPPTLEAGRNSLSSKELGSRSRSQRYHRTLKLASHLNQTRSGIMCLLLTTIRQNLAELTEGPLLAVEGLGGAGSGGHHRYRKQCSLKPPVLAIHALQLAEVELAEAQLRKDGAPLVDQVLTEDLGPTCSAALS